MRILLIGSYGRESAYAHNFERHGHIVFFAPGNAGATLPYPSLKTSDFEGLSTVAHEQKADLTVVGPEAPLCAGIQDYFAARGLVLCGPSKAAAKTEGSKVWAKYLFAEAGVPSADFAVYDLGQIPFACEDGYIRDMGPRNIVVKADGLCGGKGVFLPESKEEIAPTCERLYAEYGEAASRFVVEDRMFGPECSLIAMTDGETIYALPTARDYKRRFDDDKGLNTGGMGAYTCFVPRSTETQCNDILRRILKALRNRGIVYRGLIYVGFMLTDEGPHVMEVNCRGGDPEMQVILASLDIDFAAYCEAMARGTLNSLPEPRKVREAVCVNLVSDVYPAKSELDAPISCLSDAEAPNVTVLHYTTARWPDGPTTNYSGRVLSVVGTGETIGEARSAAYAAADVIDFRGKDLRRDIAAGI